MTIEVEVLDVAFSILVQLCVAHGNLSCREADMLPRTGFFCCGKLHFKSDLLHM